MQNSNWIGDILSDPIALAMTGLGISFIPFSEYLGGLFLALACAAWARHLNPERSRKEFWAVMWGGFIAAHLAVIAAEIWFPHWKTQLVMALAGFCSRFMAQFALRIMSRIEGSADEIGDTAANKIKKIIE